MEERGNEELTQGSLSVASLIEIEMILREQGKKGLTVSAVGGGAAGGAAGGAEGFLVGGARGFPACAPV